MSVRRADRGHRRRHRTRLKASPDVSQHVTAEIGHFFDIYKELEPGKETDVRGWQDCATAIGIIKEAFARAKS